MDNTVKALQNLYVALGGNADDVADIVLIPDMINAIASVVAGKTLLEVTEDENGKVLKVVDGEWAVGSDEITA
jgi:hypothetical protein